MGTQNFNEKIPYTNKLIKNNSKELKRAQKTVK